jgi:hypothetical protein
MNNEPVAWTAESELDNFRGGSPDICVVDEKDGEFNIPLYTHPANLTDEEILNVAFCCEVDTVSIQNDWDGTVIDFARAILRKAQEK